MALQVLLIVKTNENNQWLANHIVKDTLLQLIDNVK